MKKVLFFGVILIVVIGIIYFLAQCGSSPTALSKPPPNSAPAGGMYTGKVIAVEKSDDITTIYFDTKKYLAVAGNWDLAIGQTYAITVNKEKDGRLRIVKMEVK